MKVLIATDWYKPVINGVVTSIENLCAGLTAAGHEVRILTLSDHIYSQKTDEAYYLSSVYAGMFYPHARIGIPPTKFSLREVIEWKPDVIHTQCELSTFEAAVRVARILKVPIVHTYHTCYEDYMHYVRLNRKVVKRFILQYTKKVGRSASTLIVPTRKVADILREYHLNNEIRVIPSGIELERYLPEAKSARERIRKEFGYSEDECVLVYIGRLGQEKNLEEIFSYLSREDMKEARLLVVGDGPYRKHLEKEQARLQLGDRVQYAGMVSPDRISEYYHAGDVFVNASTSETQGLTYMEAMASGLPLLCRRDLALSGVIDEGVTGFTYSTGDAFAAHYHELSANPALRIAIGKAAQMRTIERYSISTFAKSCINVYEEAMRNAS